MIGRAEKGIFLTTGIFSEESKREASRDDAPQMELIDDQKLVSLFENVTPGVKPKIVFEIVFIFLNLIWNQKIVLTKNDNF